MLTWGLFTFPGFASRPLQHIYARHGDPFFMTFGHFKRDLLLIHVRNQQRQSLLTLHLSLRIRLSFLPSHSPNAHANTQYVLTCPSLFLTHGFAALCATFPLFPTHPCHPMHRRHGHTYYMHATPGLICLRTMKSGVALGVSEQQQSRAQAAQPEDWLTSGTFGQVLAWKA